MDHDPWSFIRKRLGNGVCEQIQERNKKDTETETVEYINNVTVACNYVCIMLFLGRFGRGCLKGDGSFHFGGRLCTLYQIGTSG